MFLPTDNSRGPWVKDMREALGFSDNGWSLNGPSVFIQGLMVCDKNEHVVHARVLSSTMVLEMDKFAADKEITVIAYTSDGRIVAREVQVFECLCYRPSFFVPSRSKA